MARACKMCGSEEVTSGRFCSVQCEVKHDHLKADAKDARLDDERKARHRYEKPVSNAEFRRMVL